MEAIACNVSDMPIFQLRPSLTLLDTCLENCNEKNLVSEGGRPFCTERKTTLIPVLLMIDNRTDNKCFMEGCQKPRCQFEDGFEDVCREREWSFQAVHFHINR